MPNLPENIQCQRCGTVLKSLVYVPSRVGLVTVTTKDLPRMERDQQGYYILCPKCGSRADFDEVPDVVSGVGFRLRK